MIFCVEDDNSIRDLMIYTLNASGFEASGFSDGEQLFEALKEKKPELIILDIMLPGEDGITILKKLRSHGNTSDIPEMVSRLKAVLRRSSPKQEKLLSMGELELNLSEHTVTSSGKRVQLTLKEFDMLRLFMENPGRVFTREQLLSGIWGTDYIGETRTVDVHIGTLRTKLGTCGSYIETVRGVGYRMEAGI